jgi:hypothetical protein
MESLIELYVFVTGMFIIGLIGRFFNKTNALSKREFIRNSAQYLVCYNLIWIYVFVTHYYMGT